MPFLQALLAIPGLGRLLSGLGKAIAGLAAIWAARRHQRTVDELERANEAIAQADVGRRVQEELRRLPTADRDRVHRRYTSDDRP